MTDSEQPLMTAVRLREWGGPLELASVPRPQPLPTEVLVRVEAAGVNPVDLFTCQGKAYNRALGLPHVPGWDVSGVVEAVGYGVTRFVKGDAVFGMPWFPRQGGAYAQYVSAPARHFAHKPAELTHIEAAALPLAGLTAWQMLVEVAHVQSGMKVLVSGGAGGVGHLVVQVAKALGASVTATARPEKHGFLRQLGADHVLDYTAAPVEDQVSDMDVVIELVGGDTCVAMLRTLRPGGLLVSAQAAWAPGLQEAARTLGVRASWYLVEPSGSGLHALATLVRQRQLKPHVDSVLSLAQVSQAHARVAERHTTGKLVLVPPGPNE
jgi:NADPH:quinone reductase-like Zn-dependent oxidoreductase